MLPIQRQLWLPLDYSYREDEELVDEREELFEEEGDMWREDEEQDYHYHDGEGLV